MTAAATANSRMLPAPRSSCAPPVLEARKMPPSAASDELTVNAVTLMWRTSIPARRAASALPPVANRWRPHVVLVSAMVQRIIKLIGTTAAQGSPSIFLKVLVLRFWFAK